MSELRLVITKHWQKEQLSDLFGEEDVFNLSCDIDPDKEYELIVTVQRGKEITEQK